MRDFTCNLCYQREIFLDKTCKERYEDLTDVNSDELVPISFAIAPVCMCKGGRSAWPFAKLKSIHWFQA